MKRIVIDPGHSDWDQGSTPCDINSGGIMEAEFNWRLSVAVADELVNGWVCEVHMTHPHNVSLAKAGALGEELHKRALMYEFYNADLLVSVHHDAGAPNARGGSLYVWTNQRDEDGGLVWAPALGNHKAPRSYAYAQKVYPKVKDALATFGVPWRGNIMCADFQVLRDCPGPCMLLECFFGTNAEDVAAARRPEFIPAIAKAFAEGIADALSMEVKAPAKDANAVSILIDGTVVECGARMEGGKTRVDVRPLLEAMGARLGWDANSKTLTVSTGHLPSWQTPRG